MATQTIFTLPDNTPLAAGNFTSPNFTFPAGINSVTVQFHVSPADVVNPAKEIILELWRFDSTSGKFVFDSGFHWVGNTKDDSGAVVSPFLTVDVGPLAGVQCQLRATLAQSITTGIVVTSA